MSSMKAIRSYLESDGRSLMNLIAALKGPVLKGQYRAEVVVSVCEEEQDPAMADMKRKFEAIREKITRPRSHPRSH